MILSSFLLFKLSLSHSAGHFFARFIHLMIPEYPAHEPKKQYQYDGQGQSGVGQKDDIQSYVATICRGLAGYIRDYKESR